MDGESRKRESRRVFSSFLIANAGSEMFSIDCRCCACPVYGVGLNPFARGAAGSPEKPSPKPGE